MQRCLTTLLPATLLAFATAGAAAQDLKIGVAGPMDGPFALLGEQMLAGAEQAVIDLNAAGGVLGRTVVLEVGDDSCDRRTADAIANQMAGRGISFMAGHLCSQPSIEASVVYDRQKIVQISPGATHPDFTDLRPGPGVFRLAARDDEQGTVAGTMLAERFSPQTIAILHDGTGYGRSLADGVRKAMNDAGKVEALFDDYDVGERDFVELVARLNELNIEVLYVGGKHVEAGLIAAEMARQGMRTRLVSGDALATEDFREIAGAASDGTLLTFTPDPLESETATETVARLAEAGIVAEGYVLPTYAAIEVWAKAVAAAGSTDFDQVVLALTAGSFDTVLGPVRFDERGDSTLPSFAIYEWQGDRYLMN